MYLWTNAVFNIEKIISLVLYKINAVFVAKNSDEAIWEFRVQACGFHFQADSGCLGRSGNGGAEG
jgi:hypothetical protein